MKPPRYRAPNKEEHEFLWRLKPGELVTRGDIGCVVMGAESRARTQCRKRGWATYEGRGTGWMRDGWVLTKSGEEARRLTPTPTAPQPGAER